MTSFIVFFISLLIVVLFIALVIVEEKKNKTLVNRALFNKSDRVIERSQNHVSSFVFRLRQYLRLVPGIIASLIDHLNDAIVVFRIRLARKISDVVGVSDRHLKKKKGSASLFLRTISEEKNKGK